MKPRYKILASVAPVVFVLDQLTKLLIIGSVSPLERIAVIPGFFDIVQIRNPGAAFGAFARLSPEIRLPFFYLTSVVALGVLVAYFIRFREERRSVFFQLSLIVGGAVANVTDRIFRKEVVDFLSFHWYDRSVVWRIGGETLRFRLEWPAFNVADAAITVGAVGLMILLMRKDPAP